MATSKAKSTIAPDAIALLTADHKEVRQLFAQFKGLKEDASNEEKSAIVEQICIALTIHAEIEEEIFYPAVREAIDDSDLMDEALVEHAGAKELIAQLQDMDPEEDLYDAKVTVLGEQIDHHVEEEEGEMFPKAKKAKLDISELGAQMAKQKELLMAQTGAEEEDSGTEAATNADDEEEDETQPKRKSARG